MPRVFISRRERLSRDNVFLCSPAATAFSGLVFMPCRANRRDPSKIAQWKCKPFKRDFKVSDPKRYNVVGEYDKADVA